MILQKTTSVSHITRCFPNARQNLPDNQRHFSLNCFLDTLSSQGGAVSQLSALVYNEESCFEGIKAYGTKMADAVAPVCLAASLTLAKTGRSKCVEPAFFGLVPPTTLVPGIC